MRHALSPRIVRWCAAVLALEAIAFAAWWLVWGAPW